MHVRILFSAKAYGDLHVSNTEDAALPLDAELLEEARRLNIDATVVAQRALFHKIRERRSKEERSDMTRKFQEENAEAFAYSNEYVEQHGLPLAKYRQF
jgi:antitoxin CcdA